MRRHFMAVRRREQTKEYTLEFANKGDHGSPKPTTYYNTLQPTPRATSRAYNKLQLQRQQTTHQVCNKLQLQARQDFSTTTYQSTLQAYNKLQLQLQLQLQTIPKHTTSWIWPKRIQAKQEDRRVFQRGRYGAGDSALSQSIRQTTPPTQQDNRRIEA
jgi:hypothetical protein